VVPGLERAVLAVEVRPDISVAGLKVSTQVERGVGMAVWLVTSRNSWRDSQRGT
jgi:hypothetical protein